MLSRSHAIQSGGTCAHLAHGRIWHMGAFGTLDQSPHARRHFAAFRRHVRRRVYFLAETDQKKNRISITFVEADRDLA
jgi:hypothetical protein